MKKIKMYVCIALLVQSVGMYGAAESDAQRRQRMIEARNRRFSSAGSKASTTAVPVSADGGPAVTPLIREPRPGAVEKVGAGETRESIEAELKILDAESERLFSIYRQWRALESNMISANTKLRLLREQPELPGGVPVEGLQAAEEELAHIYREDKRFQREAEVLNSQELITKIEGPAIRGRISELHARLERMGGGVVPKSMAPLPSVPRDGSEQEERKDAAANTTAVGAVETVESITTEIKRLDAEVERLSTISMLRKGIDELDERMDDLDRQVKEMEDEEEKMRDQVQELRDVLAQGELPAGIPGGLVNDPVYMADQADELEEDAHALEQDRKDLEEKRKLLIAEQNLLKERLKQFPEDPSESGSDLSSPLYSKRLGIKVQRARLRSRLARLQGVARTKEQQRADDYEEQANSIEEYIIREGLRAKPERRGELMERESRAEELREAEMRWRIDSLWH